MNSAYIKFENIEFQDSNHKQTAETILSDIDCIQNYLITEEQYIETLNNTIGPEYSKQIAMFTTERTKKILVALKIAFWYYTGIQASKVIINNDKNVDIFELFKENKQ